MRDHILFHINGREHRAAGAKVFATLANYLRYDAGATGTKIVCEEGDCGACTVLIRRSSREDFKPINSCIQLLCQLDGASIVTVEGLKLNGALSAVQEAMVIHQGAQCGYCTPGFIVAMSAMYETSNRVDEQQVRVGLTGNLCRCTGYEPILKAALDVDATNAPKVREIYPHVPDARDAVRVENFFAPTALAAAGGGARAAAIRHAGHRPPPLPARGGRAGARCAARAGSAGRGPALVALRAARA